MPVPNSSNHHDNASQAISTRFDEILALLLFYEEIHAVRRHRLHQFYVHRAAYWLGSEMDMTPRLSDGLCGLTIDWMEREKDVTKMRMRMRMRGEEQEVDEGAMEELFQDLEEGWTEDGDSVSEEDEEQDEDV